ncbi:outer membrane biogenesis protein BamB [Gimesia chilikensis]|uniref:Outer membrane biogenesis protein BamB n=1 Tax=Gimesia chilikensis TaxID=2605989 RepID=A0A517WGT0_9PLAN|nr:PQQ-binding-like beta-propeller repeat protein [Gimesia chilikensis]QDU04457.1 outer membrane biogenesis protein BamB [Gimesia chilikensis]
MRLQIVLTLLLWFCAALPAQDRWPGFLGVGASSISASSIPTEWAPDKNLAWQVAIPGYGQSSPVIWGERVFTTSVEGENKEILHVVCYSLRTGKLLWKHSQSSTFPEKNSVYISRAAPTPVVDADGIYAYFESGDIISLTHTGQRNWSVSLKERFGAPQNKFGLAASPVQLKNRLMILIDDEGPSCLTAISKADGKTLWKTNRKSRISWSSPMLVPFDDSVQVVCSSAGSLEGYDPQNGKLLWSFNKVGGNDKTTPLPVGQGAFLVGASPGRSGENNDLAKKSNGLFLVKQSGEEWITQYGWTNPGPVPSWASPMMYRGYAYWVNRVGVVYCLDINNGQVAYTERLKQSCWATPVGVGDYVYFFSKDGITTVLKSGDTFEVVAENRLWTDEAPPVNRVPSAEEESEDRRRSAALFSRPTVYGVALVKDYLVLRTGSQLFCIQSPLLASLD